MLIYQWGRIWQDSAEVVREMLSDKWWKRSRVLNATYTNWDVSRTNIHVPIRIYD